MIDALVSAPVLLAAVLLLAAAAKWNHRPSLVSATRLLRLPAALERPAQWLPPIEAALAAALLITPWASAYVVVAALTCGLMLSYTVVVARGLRMTPRPSCGCFGTIGAPITPETLLRNVVLTGLAGTALGWGLAGHTVSQTLVPGTRATWSWLLALVVTAALTRWVVRDRTPSRPGYAAAAPPEFPPAPVDPDDYVRERIPPLMFLDGDRPVTLSALARQRAQLLVFVTCSCGRSHTAVDLAREWHATMPQIDVRVIAATSLGFEVDVFDWPYGWLRDPDGQALASLDIAGDPVGLLLGADGLLAGGPVSGVEALAEFGQEIAAALAELPDPERTGAPSLADQHG